MQWRVSVSVALCIFLNKPTGQMKNKLMDKEWVSEWVLMSEDWVLMKQVRVQSFNKSLIWILKKFLKNWKKYETQQRLNKDTCCIWMHGGLF